ncbi:tetratricopeptide repeat protein [Actinacidiphila acidipaludis]|uniref:Tetratricopeptide repeat protein n=1 Tax=Actinacidiphila acidipaludis TaxID=2873382 RepID=A0ABS7QF00_9ACTN|nr:tetratricopeptide repeat protein [Streptomyces acidipaludis]MBY8881284.1 tetratricopeptide repeat protein [Streptomyces acidipaludis]
MTRDERIGTAELLYERAVFGGDDNALEGADAALDAVEADLCMTRGRVVHARFLDSRRRGRPAADPRELELFERAARLYRRSGDTRGEGEAAFWVGTFHQVVRDDTETALPSFRLALDLATRSGDRLTMSYALRHLGFAEHMAGDLDEARRLFEESTRLRREVDFLPGVAANLIGLAYVAAQQQRRDEAARFLKEAEELSARTASHGVLLWAAEAREELELP